MVLKEWSQTHSISTTWHLLEVHILRPFPRLTKPGTLGEEAYNLFAELFQGILMHTKEKSSASGPMRSGMFLEGKEHLIRLDKN